MVAITQRIMPVRMRALATALLYLLLNLIGPGAGPLAAGILNDALVGYYGVEAIRYVLSNVRGGRSTTLLDVPLARLTTGRLIVNIQESPASLHAAKDARSVSCGSITRARLDRGAASDGSLR